MDGAGDRARRFWCHEGAAAGEALYHPFALELAVRLEHGVGIDRQLCDRIASGRELIAGTQDPVAHGASDLLDELAVGRDSGALVETERDHEVLYNYFNSTSQTEDSAPCWPLLASSRAGPGGDEASRTSLRYGD